GEDPEKYIRNFRQYCKVFELDPLADARTKVRTHGFFETCLKVINGLANNNALRNINANQFKGGALQIRNTVPANNNAIAIPLVPAHTEVILFSLIFVLDK
ncbi:17962_t:CDS:2, partial [Acaulospora morrowiae]